MKNFALDILLVVIGVFMGVVLGGYAALNTHEGHTKAIEEYMIGASGCKNLGAPTNMEHPMAKHVDHVLACPDGSIIVFPK